MKKLHEIREAVRNQQPLIHCITNPISINQCANGILAIGARPMMAEHPKEVREITETAGALMLNLGNITDARMESMKISMLTAKEKSIPVMLDAVGIACSKLRRDYIAELLEIGIPTVIKGNYSEVFALYHDAYRSSGVDADASINAEAITHAAAELARKYHTTILASGKTDNRPELPQQPLQSGVQSQYAGRGQRAPIRLAVVCCSASRTARPQRVITIPVPQSRPRPYRRY